MSADILVDTSVWVEAYRNGIAEVPELEELTLAGRLSTCGLVLLELLRGVRNEVEYKEVVQNMGSLHYLETSPEVYLKASEISYGLRRKGLVMGLADSLIAGTALVNHQTLFTLDKDFDRVPGLKVKRA